MATIRRQASIMGSSFCPGASNIIPRIRPGAPIRWEREATNQYDVNAIALYLSKQKLGYLPRGLAAELAPQVDLGTDLKITKSQDPKFATSGVVVVAWDVADPESA